MKIPIIVVGGPTASGKTALSIQLAKRFDGEIVSADSMQIYKYMDIGTAKPTLAERDGIVHHMIDIADPSEPYSVAQYTQKAHEVIANICARKKTPVIVGGTGLYINSLVNDVDFLEEDADNTIREELALILQNKGAEPLITELRECDPVSAERLHPSNLRRIIRAIEFFRATGVPISVHQEETKKKQSRYEPVMFAVLWDREKLYQRIDQRVDIMMSDGLLDEVKGLMARGYTKDMTSMQGIGYRQLIGYLENEMTLDEAVEIIKRDSRRYAKRQMTWFRKDERIYWLNPERELLKQASDVINKLG